MRKTFKKVLKEAVADFGLTDKAIDDLTKIGCEGLADDASEEDIRVKALTLVPYAKMMQAEITRKGMANKSQSTEPSADKGEGNGEGATGNDKDVPEWAKQFQSELAALKKENADLKAKEAQAVRQSEIAAAAKKFGIPDYLLKRIALADDANIEKELGDFRQDLVNNNLMPKDQAHEQGADIDALKADAAKFAKAL